jgi:spermidine synthase
MGLGLGHTIAAVAKELPQKRANFIIAEPLGAMWEWHRSFVSDSPLTSGESRLTLENDCGPATLHRLSGTLHAILVHLDASPTGPRHRTWVDERRWVAAAYEALQPGGLLAIAGSRAVPTLTRRLQGSGFEVAEFTVPSSANAKRPRFLPIWLARKGKAAD